MAAARGKDWILLSKKSTHRQLHLVELDAPGTADEAWAVARRGLTLNALDAVTSVVAIRVSDMQAVQVQP
jgi:hypothetical protein